MTKLAKKGKKTVRKNSRRKEVEIPVFVISKKEKVNTSVVRGKTAPKKNKEREKEFTILKDKDDLPVFHNFSNIPAGDKRQEEFEGERNNSKSAAHKNIKEVIEERVLEKAPLPESKKIIIMWASVAVFACLIFFVWFSSLKNNFSDFFGSTSFTFSRQDGTLEELNRNLEELENQTNFPKEKTEPVGTIDGKETDFLGEIKEKILVEELKNKLE